MSQKYGATYSTERENFGEITHVFPVDDDWQGYTFHGYCWASPSDVAVFYASEGDSEGDSEGGSV